MTAFWRPGRPGQYARWWARCDICNWSGPLERFTVYWRMPGVECTICDHYWCDNDDTAAALKADGWQHPAAHFRGGK